MRYKVAVLCGGLSSEREVSLKSGKMVGEALRELGHEVIYFDPAEDLGKIIEEKDEIDIFFPVLHGKYGEDGTIQGFFELLQKPYVGCGVLASALAMDKYRTITTFRQAGLPVASSMILETIEQMEEVQEKIGFPCVMKLVNNGSSIGVKIVADETKFREAWQELKKYDDQVMVEKFIKGREITVGVVGNDNLQAMPVIEIVAKNEFFDFEAKYNGETQEIVPAQIDDDLTCRAQELAKQAHQALGCRGLSRTDMIIKDREIFLLETNTMPGMTDQSLLPKAAKAFGWDFKQLLAELLDLAREGKDGTS